MAKLDAAPYDDEDLTEDDQAALRDALAEPAVPWSEVEPELRAD
jgi:hypothetical protein